MWTVISSNISSIPIDSTAVESKGQYLCYSQLYYTYRTATCFPEATLQNIFNFYKSEETNTTAVKFQVKNKNVQFGRCFE